MTNRVFAYLLIETPNEQKGYLWGSVCEGLAIYEMLNLGSKTARKL
jgi:hypothetical protein